MRVARSCIVCDRINLHSSPPPPFIFRHSSFSSSPSVPSPFVSPSSTGDGSTLSLFFLRLFCLLPPRFRLFCLHLALSGHPFAYLSLSLSLSHTAQWFLLNPLVLYSNWFELLSPSFTNPVARVLSSLIERSINGRISYPSISM